MPRMMQHQVPENLLRHIGDITVSFALLENTLQMVVHSLVASSQRIGQIITAELGFKNLRALSISLYKERLGEGDKFDQFRALLRRAAEAEDKRNQTTHSLWAAGDSPETITRIKTTAKENMEFAFTSNQSTKFNYRTLRVSSKFLPAISNRSGSRCWASRLQNRIVMFLPSNNA